MSRWRSLKKILIVEGESEKKCKLLEVVSFNLTAAVIGAYSVFTS